MKRTTSLWKVCRAAWMLVAMMLSSQVFADTFALDPGDSGRAVIVIPGAADAVDRFAAAELQKHLALVLGEEISVVAEDGVESVGPFFRVGIRAPGDGEPLGPEEARYRVTRDAVYLYGEDRVNASGQTPRASIIGGGALRFNRVGTLFAVYLFLERELGIRWLEPGDAGIAYEARSVLRIPVGEGSWKPYFKYQRNLRSYAWRGADQPAVFLPDEFVLSAEEALERRAELEVWLRRMRMGAVEYLNFGHAFSRWWEKHGDEHPDYFALNGNGVRGPLNRDKPDRVKMCVSNPGLVRQAVGDWQEERNASPLARPALCVAVNDGGGGGAAEFCHCEGCRALDVVEEGEVFGDHLTDRYMYLANQALAAARQVDPDARVTAYAYSRTRQPPRRQRLGPGIVLQFVTAMPAPFAETRALYEGWQKQGATEFLFRPNDLCIELGLPLGHEERIAAHQRLAVEMGAMGTDHDSVYGLWTGISGITYYVLARSHVDPAQDFEYWEREYAAAYGQAQPEALAYFRHWRRKFDEVILPEDRRARAAGDRGFLGWNRLRGVSSRVREFYDEADFDYSDSLLTVALERELTPETRRHVERLALANRHSRLTFEAMAAVNGGDASAVRRAASALLDFRKRAKDRLRMNWRVLFSTQHQMGDATGITSLLIEPIVAGRRSFSCVRAQSPPRIDGMLKEGIWEEAALDVGFVVNRTAETPRTATMASLAYDDENLYVGVRCTEPLMDELVEQVRDRDGAVWTDNAVEIFIDGRASQTDFHQFIISSAGVLLDGRMAGGAFTGSWDVEVGSDIEYAVGKHADSWIVEMRIGLAAAGMEPPRPGGAIGFNLARDRNVSVLGESEASALAPTFGGFHMPERFARLVFR